MAPAKQQAPAALATPASSATTWDIDPAHSSAEFEVRHLMISFVSGRFKGLQGSIQADEASPERSQVQATIDAASVDTGMQPRDEHLRSPDFFDVAQHPTITFASKRVEVLGPERARIVGDLTLRGATREVALDARRTGTAKDPWGKQRVGVRAEAAISLKDFGLTWNQPIEGGFLLGDKVDITLRLEAVRREAA